MTDIDRLSTMFALPGRPFSREII